MSKPALSVEEPFQLSTYTSSYRGKQKFTSHEHVFVNSIGAKSKGDREGLVTVAAQADGIHLVDVSSLHSVVSHTLGPSTSFSCPAITIIGSHDEECVTCAVIETSPELENSEEGGRVVWKWTDNLSSVSVSAQKPKLARIVVPAPQRLHGIYTVPELSGRILGVTEAGNVLLLDSHSLEERTSLALSEQPVVVYRTSIFASSTCSFGSKATNATAIVLSFDKADSLNIHIVSVDSNDEVLVTSQFRLSQNRETLSDVSCNEAGSISILNTDGSWSSYALSAGSPPQFRPLARPFKLANFAFTSQKSNSAVSMSALTSHHVLLAALSSTPSTTIHIQVWDLQYSVLLTSHALPVPSAFSSSPLSLKLVSDTRSNSGRGQAILVLSTTRGSKASSQTGTSSLFVVSYVVPLHSTLAVAMGRGFASKPWVQTVEVSTNKSKAQVEEEKVLGSVRAAMESGKAKAAESAFAAWLKDAEADKGASASDSPLGYNFVKELLGVLLPPKPTGVYPVEIMKTLLERRAVVSSSMVEKGLLRALRERNDWASVELAFSTVVDLSESDIVQALVALIKLQQQHPDSGEAMQVDGAPTSTNVTIPLPTFLSLCVMYPNTTSKGLVLAMKQWVRDPQDAAAIAQILENWIKTSVQQRKANGEIGLLPSNKDLDKNEHGVWVVSTQKKAKKGSSAKKTLPSLVKVVEFLQSFMDACFLQLLQHTPSHKVLQQLQPHIVEEASFSDILEQLRGPLEPFAVGHQKSLREAAIPEKEKERQRQKGDWRQRRNGAPAVVGAVGAIGVYQIEEFVL